MADAKKRTGVHPLSYLGVEPTTPPQLVIQTRQPLEKDRKNYNLGTIWIIRNPREIWILPEVTNGRAQWVQLYPGSGAGATEFPTDSGTAIENNEILNILGGLNINTEASNNDVTVNLNEIVSLPETDVNLLRGMYEIGDIQFHAYTPDSDAVPNIFIGESPASISSMETNFSANIGIGSNGFNTSSLNYANTIGIGNFVYDQQGAGSVGGIESISIGDFSTSSADSTSSEPVGGDGAIAIGYQAMYQDSAPIGGTGGGGAIAIGHGAMESGGGDYSIAIGNAALVGDPVDRGIAIGAESETGAHSVSIGDEAGCFIERSVAIGNRSLLNTNSLADTIVIGYESGKDLPNTSNNNIIIGHPGTATTNNTIRIGNTNHTALYCDAARTSISGNDVLGIDSNGQIGVTTQDGSAGVKETVFTSSGTWNKDPNTKRVKIYAFGGASGGFGAYKIDNSDKRSFPFKATPGQSGSTFFVELNATFFNNSETITIGAGGSGGTGSSGSSGTGIVGSDGGNTSIGSVLETPPFQDQGFSTTLINGVGEVRRSSGFSGFGSYLNPDGSEPFITTDVFNRLGGNLLSPDSFAATRAAFNNVLGLNNVFLSGTAGGIGGSTGPRVGNTSGKNGVQIIFSNLTRNGGAAGTTASGQQDGSNGVDAPSSFSYINGGTGGGGGAAGNNSLEAGNGGNGGYPAGGGGAGGVQVASGPGSAGSGGDGGDGKLIIIEFS